MVISVLSSLKRANILFIKFITSSKTHNLVANEFLERPFNKPFIHHIDRSHRNNAINSLRFRVYPVNIVCRSREDSDDCEEYESEEGECDEDAMKRVVKKKRVRSSGYMAQSH